MDSILSYAFLQCFVPLDYIGKMDEDEHMKCVDIRTYDRYFIIGKYWHCFQ